MYHEGNLDPYLRHITFIYKSKEKEDIQIIFLLMLLLKFDFLNFLLRNLFESWSTKCTVKNLNVKMGYHNLKYIKKFSWKLIYKMYNLKTSMSK